VRGLHDELHPGRRRSIGDERIARLVKRILETKPGEGTHWTVREMANKTGLSKTTVPRIW